MSTGAIGGASNSVASASSAYSNISSDDFMKILISELSNQDPFKPQDSAALLEQLSSIRNIESQLSLEKNLQSLVDQNQLAMAGGMIGKLVVGKTENNVAVEGLVTAIRVQDGKAVLELDNAQTLPLSRVLLITEPDAV